MLLYKKLLLMTFGTTLVHNVYYQSVLDYLILVLRSWQSQTCVGNVTECTSTIMGFPR